LGNFYWFFDFRSKDSGFFNGVSSDFSAKKIAIENSFVASEKGETSSARKESLAKLKETKASNEKIGEWLKSLTGKPAKWKENPAKSFDHKTGWLVGSFILVFGHYFWNWLLFSEQKVERICIRF